MGIAPPVKPDVVRMTGHHEVKKSETVMIRKDSFHGDRKLVTYINGGPKGWRLEADVMGQLDERGFIRNDLIFGLNCMCLSCSESFWIRPTNKTFWIQPSETPCPVVGGGVPVIEGYDCGLLTVREKLKCPSCGYTFRITDGVCSDV